MKAFFALDYRFVRNSKGAILGVSPSYSYYYWKNNYLGEFDELCLMGRLSNRPCEEHMPTVKGDRISFYELPDFHGAFMGITKIPIFLKRLWDISKQQGIFVLRVNGYTSSLLWFILKLRRKPYVLEIVAFPEDALSLKAYGSIFVHLFVRPLLVLLTKLQCSSALAASYVTSRALQERYPAKRAVVTAAITDVILPEELLKPNKNRWSNIKKIRIVSLGNLSRPYKGFDILLRSFAQLVKDKPNLELWIIGDGKLLRDYKKLARKLSVGDKVTFFSRLKYDELFEKLSQAHLFVMPSRQEGMPRALIEAMASGLPCIGTKVGGIPELLEEDCLVPPDEVEALYRKIMYAISDLTKLRKLGESNRKKTILEFHPDVLRKKRNEFYTSVIRLYEKQ